jgi:hypothetical protein
MTPHPRTSFHRLFLAVQRRVLLPAGKVSGSLCCLLTQEDPYNKKERMNRLELYQYKKSRRNSGNQQIKHHPYPEHSTEFCLKINQIKFFFFIN